MSRFSLQSITASWLKAYITAGVVVLGFVICLAADLPGHLSYDSVIQLLEGRTAQYSSWHPPVMSWLLGLFDAIVPGTALFVVFDTLLFFGSLLSLVWLRPVTNWAAAIAASVILPLPIVLLYQGIVWKDVLFADTMVAGFVCIVWAASRWRNVRLRFALIAAGLLLLCLAAMARQNGILALGAAVAALGWIAFKLEPDPRRAVLTCVLGAMAFAAVAMTVANVALGTRIVAESGPAAQFRLLQIYDIIGFVAADKTLKLDELQAWAPSLEREIRVDGVRLYNPERNDPLAASQTLQDALSDAPRDAVRGQWLDLILHHPFTYLKIRAEVFRWIFLTPDIQVCLPYLTGVSGPEEEMHDLNIAERQDARDDALSAWTDHFIRTPVLSHLFYALLALASAILLLRRGRPEDIAVAALQIAALLFTASFFVIGIACDYRYLYALDIASLVAVFYIALDWSGFGEVSRFLPQRARWFRDGR